MSKAKGGKKQVEKIIKLQLQAGKANPAPPTGPALGAAGVNIMAFCKDFNARTQGMGDAILPVVISVYGDKSFTYILKKPPVARQLLKKAGIEKGSGVPNRNKVAKITEEQAREVAREKMEDLNARDEDAALQIVKGTARSMGIDVG